MIDENFLNDLPSTVDACGENGEFHSFAYSGPVFKYPIPFIKGEIVYKEYKAPKNTDVTSVPEKSFGFYFCDLL